jgi:hypothetical protein
VARVLNLTQRDYAYMRRGPGFHGSLTNVDVSSDPTIDHISIDKSPRLHARVISEVLAVVGAGHRVAEPTKHGRSTAASHHEPNGAEHGGKPSSETDGAAKSEGPSETPVKPGNGATNVTGSVKPMADSSTPVIAAREKGVPATSNAATIPQ